MTDASQPVPRVVMIAPMVGSERDEPGIPGGRYQVEEQSIFQSMLKAVIPARPVSSFKFYEAFEIVPFDEAAARQFDDLRR